MRRAMQVVGWVASEARSGAALATEACPGAASGEVAAACPASG